jgi:PAS domain S-box-containing protein
MIYVVCVIYDMLTSSFTSQPIFGIDKMGNVNEWNVKTSEITGFSHDEAFNKPLVDTFIVPSLRKSVHDVMENALKGIETSNYELEFRTKSNEIRYLLVNATSRRDAENNIVGVVGVAQDVTEAAQHDRAVAAMANELRTLIDTANAVSYLIYDICVIRV